MLSQTQIRAAWEPRCRGPWATMTLHGGGRVVVDPIVAVEALPALDRVLRAFTYTTRAKDTGGYVCRKATNKNVYSTHAYGVAVDLNWQTNPYGRQLRTDMPAQMCAAICRIRTRNGKQVWNWGGFWSGNKDAMHFEVVCAPRDLATGIDWSTVHGHTAQPQPARPPITAPMEDDDMYVRNQQTGEIFAMSATHYRYLGPVEWKARVEQEGARYRDVHPWVLAGMAASRKPA